MKHFVLAGGSLYLMAVLVTVAGAAERVVVVPIDDKAFKVGEKDVVRLTGKGIAGAKIEAKVEGPGKITMENHVVERSKGGPLIGSYVKEFEITPSGKGKVKVTITVTPPQKEIKAVVTTYEFEVE